MSYVKAELLAQALARGERLEGKVEQLQGIVDRMQCQLRHFADRIDCRCSKDYTKRGRHGPNCTWDLAEEIRKAAAAVKEA